jgi:hypothetical protein
LLNCVSKDLNPSFLRTMWTLTEVTWWNEVRYKRSPSYSVKEWTLGGASGTVARIEAEYDGLLSMTVSTEEEEPVRHSFTLDDTAIAPEASGGHHGFRSSASIVVATT